jgi:hypothetical protein
MLGNYVSAYSSLGGDKVQIGKPLTWELYPLDPTKKAPGVRCNLVQYGGSFSVALYGGDAPIGYESGGFITEPGNVEKYLSELRKVSEFYQKRMRNSPR